MTGILMAQTRGRKSACRGWSSSTKGYWRIRRERRRSSTHHEKGPDGVVQKDHGCYDEHAETDEDGKLASLVAIRRAIRMNTMIAFGQPVRVWN
jgi:hypothetical protein